MNNKLEKFWTHINYRSDFTLSEQFIDREGATINPLSMDWRIVYTVPCSAPRTYIASYENGVLTNATVDTETNTVYVSFDNHGLPIGVLVATIEYSLPNSTFADGAQTIVQPKITGVKLWDGASDCIKAEPSAFLLDYMQGESAYDMAVAAGFSGTAEELSEALERVPSIPEILIINTTKLALRRAEYGKELYDKVTEAKTNAKPLLATASNVVTTQRIINLQYDSKTSEVVIAVEDIPKTTDGGVSYAFRIVFFTIASDGTITKAEYKGNVGGDIKYTPQELTEAQKAQARANIGVDSVIVAVSKSLLENHDTTHALSIYNALASADSEGKPVLFSTLDFSTEWNVSAFAYSRSSKFIKLQFTKIAKALGSGVRIGLVVYKITETGEVSTMLSKSLDF